MTMSEYRSSVRNRIYNRTKISSKIGRPGNREGFSACEECGGEVITDDIRGEYKCKICGLVQEHQVLEYHRPYNEEVIQNAVIGTTQIGFRKERLRCSRSVQLEKLNRLQSIRDNKKSILEHAKIEITRIFNALEIPNSLHDIIFQSFKKLRDKIPERTKYRSVEKLVPITIYHVFRHKNLQINEEKLLEVSKISKKDFNKFKLMIQDFLPKLGEYKRRDYIQGKIMEITQTFDLGMPFYYHSKMIMDKLWEIIKDTKDTVIAGLVSSITILCSTDRSITVNHLCKEIGIRMSTIQSQVERKIFKTFKISGFTSLVKSSNLLKDVLAQRGILEVSEGLEEESETLELESSELIKEVEEQEPEMDETIMPEIIEVNLNCGTESKKVIALRNNGNPIIFSNDIIKDYIQKNYSALIRADHLFTVDGIQDEMISKAVWYLNGKGPPQQKREGKGST